MYLITSDSHFGDASIIGHERFSKFSNISDHDETMFCLWEKWIGKLKKDDTFFFLGDFCENDMELYYASWLSSMMESYPCKKVMVRGNHDKKIDKRLLLSMFDEVYDYPIFISNRIVLSHFPQAVYSSQVNVHGHTHGMKLADKNHICASVHVHNYNPVSEQEVNSTIGKVDKWCTRYLYEPWASDYVLTQKHKDAVADENGRIDLSASRISHMIRLGVL